MNDIKDERKLLVFTYLLCIMCFFNVSIVGNIIDRSALILGIVMCVIISYSYIIIKRFFPDGDKYILVFSSILNIIGIVELYRLNQLLAIKQTLWYTLGNAIFIIIVIVVSDLKAFNRYKYLYLIVTVLLMALGTFLGQEIGGAKNWIRIGAFSFQPSEFGKITLIAYLASVLEDYGTQKQSRKFSIFDNVFDKYLKKYDIHESYKSLIEPALVVMVCLGFMVLQKDLGSALILFAISVTMLYIATSKFKYVITCIILFAIGSVISYCMFSHVRIRIEIWLDPWKYAYAQGSQIVQSLIAIVSGGLSGAGLGLGKPWLVPVVTTDFIYAAICEEFGILVGIAVIILYFLLFYRLMRAAVSAKDNFSRLLAVGYSTMIASQALVIIGGVTGAVPLTGITLPLVSYGGSSLVITYFSLGIVQKISEEGI
ncbi:lipid II flippase FtsW [Clostridium tepidiprofundi DSM 19306]|uniref:Lipid II flippase FtsW n=1 Tax=Clostridium tepidiprofundi DSM 19306 TaxID=1121338 RepID=A0A151B6K5_9CLOT|nr:FtsW/RodA/SpoVE family cell cycle protein [Clostridium tepidiprofundi]KYH35410.1 lipid II flippase FtsW [Clostridium tepidiprofundi DSM 19306]